jgi:hypothetical protein
MMKWLNVAGLVFPSLGALVLLAYPSPAQPLGVTQEGEGIIRWTTSPTEANRAQWKKYRYGYQIGVALLALGFVLQLVAAILQQ